ncbi:MAG: 3'(2'),5'-bisphosphate nucleotidase CysQ [Myxococcota bacterium]
MTLERELDVAIDLAKRASHVILDVYAKDFAVAYKQPRDPVTDADARANALIVAALREAFPDDGVVAEESPDRSDALQAGRCWYVDPLDGTKEFIAKNGEFAVMIGLTIDRASVLGVVLQPAKDKLYAGVVGEGAWLETGALAGTGERRPLTVSETADTSALRLVTSRSHRDAATDGFVKALGITAEQPHGSVGLKVGLIAERQADVYIHPSNRASAWDACAPEAILRAAGGRFMRMDGAPFRYGGTTDMANHGGILACNAAAYDAVLAAAKDAAAVAGLPTDAPGASS